MGASLLYSTTEPGFIARHRVHGRAGQVAISYPSSYSSPSSVKLFSSAQLLTPPTPPAVSWPVTAFSTQDGGGFDLGLTHNSLVYDSGRNLYYASVPGSVIGSGNSIAAIDPATRGVTHSAPIGSEPNALAIAADGSALYVGLDGSGEVLKLSLPSMTPLGRSRLGVDSSCGRARAQTIAVSRGDASLVALPRRWVPGFTPRRCTTPALL